MAPRGRCAEAAAEARAGRIAVAPAYIWETVMQCEHKKRAILPQDPSPKRSGLRSLIVESGYPGMQLSPEDLYTYRIVLS